MESEMDETVRSKAIEWVVRMRDADDDDWTAFETWLAETPAHVAAYQAMEDLDLDLDPLLSDLVFREAANDEDGPGSDRQTSAPVRRWWVAGGAIAAALAAAVALAPQILSQRYEVYTRPGETRVVTLDPGTHVTLNGGSRMLFDRKDPRMAVLKDGEALFEVRHDAAHPFRLEVGGRTVQDAGTVFNVAYESRAIRVAVAEGKVIYNPGAQQQALAAGDALAVSQDGQAVSIKRTDSATVGKWREGQLSYSGEPLSRVAADLSRTLGIKLRADPSIAARPYFGTIVVRRGDRQQIDDLMIALDVIAVPETGGLVMKPRGNDPH